MRRIFITCEPLAAQTKGGFPMAIKVFIDGQEGTTGLQLQARLSRHPNVALMLIEESLRRDVDERKRLINSADAVFLCLPDDAAKQAVALVDNPDTRIIDASTAHRVSAGWAYGLPELSDLHRSNIANAKRIANPGCHATGFAAAVYPLIALGIAGADYPFSCHSITGYSGGGKKMIAEYEAADRPAAFDSPRQYGLTLAHKHLPEMQGVCGLTSPPIFNPIVCDFYSGMAVSVPLNTALLKTKLSRAALERALSDYYANQPLLSVHGPAGNGFLAANELSASSALKLYVLGNDEQLTLVSVFDNLGKGASGAAVQNMNIAFGLDETTSLSGGLE
jgi:N-acetyl-gamma-glutamyl-phosphate reductase